MTNLSTKLLNRIVEFSRNKFKKHNDLYSSVISVCEIIPELELCSLFVLEGELLDFELKSTFPKNSHNENSNFLDECINLGIVGKALESGLIEFHQINNSNIILIPLRSEAATNGILLIKSGYFDIDESTSNLFSLFGNILGNFINQKNILNDLENSKSLLEQKVAIKTMDLTQSKREIEAIFNSVLTGILIFDTLSRKIVNANPIALELIGVNQNEINEFYIDEFLSNELKNPIASFSPIESEIMTIDKVYVPILRNTTYLNLGTKQIGIESFLDISSLKRAEQKLINANQILELKVQERTEDLQLLVHKLKNEITEREMAENELRRLFDKERELNYLKTKFVSMVSHEFRTPLTIIRSSAQMLEKFRDNLNKQEVANFYKKIMHSVDNMADLIENVIFIGKSEATGLKLNHSFVDIITFCEQIILDIKLSYDPNRNVLFKYKGDYHKIYTDEKILRLILYNLLSNAFKYSTKEKSVEFNVSIFDDKFEFEIIDFGIGIPIQEQTKIFELFYRADNVGNISGTGLGLSVVVDSVEKLGGKIEMTSIPNFGSKFIVRIPTKHQKENYE